MAQFERILLPGGRPGFRKHDREAPPGQFSAEAAGLAALAASATVRVPAVLRVDPTEIVTELLEEAPATPPHWARLGQQLAALHARPAPTFGFPLDNYCGATPQPNPLCPDGHEFFAEQRLRYQARLARDSGRLATAECRRVDRLCERLADLVPPQPPALLHGDLWRGNALFTAAGPWLIDPAVYWGWPEADLAMTTLFGRFDESFYRAYQEAGELTPGWEERLPLYNLYHLLNHLNLFGAGYHAQVLGVLARYD
jgi:fructosamine-3-kinase